MGDVEAAAGKARTAWATRSSPWVSPPPQHAPALARIEQLIARGRRDGVFRTDLPLSWLMTTTYALFHAAAEDIDAGRLQAENAPQVLEATLLPALAPPRADPAPRGP